MNQEKIIIFSLVVSFLLIPFSTQAEEVDPNFNPNNIITDSQMLNYDSMDLKEIQDFLAEQDSYLSKHVTESAHGNVKTAAEIIYDSAVNNFDCEDVDLGEDATEREKKEKCEPKHTVNPKFLIALLQKEQSLIEDSNPEQGQLDWATGYGCPDNQDCNPYWKGFGKQVNSAALQFKWYMKTNNKEYDYQKHETYEFKDIYSEDKDTLLVTPQNDATAALYNYTPHVYHGNYNLYKIWKRYFPAQKYPDGTLLQAKDEVGVWLIQDGEKRPFVSKVALTSRFDTNKIVKVDKSTLSAYPKGAPIKYSNYSIIRSPKGEIYLLVDNKKRRFSSMDAFRSIGYNLREITDAGWEIINSYEEGKVITEQSSYPTGALLQDKETGGIYWVKEGEKAPVLDKSFLTYKFKDEEITPVEPKELEEYPTTDPVLFDNGELLKSSASPAVYLIDNGKKRAFASGQDFLDMGYKWENVITTSPQVLYKYPEGRPVKIDN